jgi:hypothetical protein
MKHRFKTEIRQDFWCGDQPSIRPTETRPNAGDPAALRVPDLISRKLQIGVTSTKTRHQAGPRWVSSETRCFAQEHRAGILVPDLPSQKWKPAALNKKPPGRSAKVRNASARPRERRDLVLPRENTSPFNVHGRSRRLAPSMVRVIYVIDPESILRCVNPIAGARAIWFWRAVIFGLATPSTALGADVPLLWSDDSRPSMFLIKSISSCRASAVSSGSSA